MHSHNGNLHSELWERFFKAIFRASAPRSPSIWILIVAGFLASFTALNAQSSPPLPLGKAVQNGISVEFSLEQVSGKDSSGAFREQDDVVVRFAVVDSASGTPLRGIYPAAWMDLMPAGQKLDAGFCSQRVKALLDGSLFARAELDLNAFYVLVLNDDASISVVDPMFSFGNSKLLDLISLAGRGEDWALSSNQQKLFVSMPEKGQVAVIDTATWKLVRNIDIGPRPTRVALQPDQHYLWIAYGESDPAISGVAVMDTSEFRVVEHIKTGAGVHDLTFSSDSRVAFVSNSIDGSVSLIDPAQLKKIADLATAKNPVSITFSSLSQRAYLAHQNGTIAVIDGSQRKVVDKIQSEAGLDQIRFAPGGRWGFVLNAAKNEVHVLDASTGRLIQSGKTEEAPDQVDFSDTLAYIRHRRSGTVLMVPLDQLGLEGKPLAPADFTGGQNPFGSASRSTPADGIIKAPGANAVLVANPADKSVYYYEEGMAAPKGQFSNYGREALAVLVVDRSLKDHQPGVYETVARLRRPGHYVVPFVMFSPQVVHCFEMTVDPQAAPTNLAQQPKVELLLPEGPIKTGQTVHLRFRLASPQTNEPLQALHDVRVLISLSSGISRQQSAAVPDGPGIYAIDFIPSRSGTYQAYVECPSHGLTLNNSHVVTLHVEDSGAQQ